VTSGVFGPSADAPVAMGCVPSHLAALGATLCVELRGKRLLAQVVEPPFVPHRYKRA